MSSTRRNFRDAIDALNSCQTNFATLEAMKKSGKTRDYASATGEMLEWTRRAGYPDPQVFDKLNIIHVTGTKGKGSTCAFVQSILSQYQGQGKPLGKIGLYTSPHLKTVRERIRINGEPIGEEKFQQYFFEVWDKLDETESDVEKYPEMGPGGRPSYFRYLTILAFHVFMREQVDTAILEVGIGGEFDSTNIIVSPTATGVSTLGIDHVQVLGDTIDKIAWNKGGIYKPSALALTVPQPDLALSVLKDRAQERHTSLEVVDVYPEVQQTKLGLPAKFQETNASLAVRLCIEHLKKLGVDIDLTNGLPKEFIAGLEQASWPGRCQTIDNGAVTWHLDGAHTNESLDEAAKWFKTVFNKDKTTVLLFNQQKRDANALVGTLYESLADSGIKFDHVIFSNNVTWKQGYNAELASMATSKEEVDNLVVQKALSEAWHDLDPNSQRHVYGSIQEAQQFIESIPGPVQVLVTGSLHLVGGLLAVMDGDTSV